MANATRIVREDSDGHYIQYNGYIWRPPWRILSSGMDRHSPSVAVGQPVTITPLTKNRCAIGDERWTRGGEVPLRTSLTPRIIISGHHKLTIDRRTARMLWCHATNNYGRPHRLEGTYACGRKDAHCECTIFLNRYNRSGREPTLSLMSCMACPHCGRHTYLYNNRCRDAW